MTGGMLRVMLRRRWPWLAALLALALAALLQGLLQPRWRDHQRAATAQARQLDARTAALRARQRSAAAPPPWQDTLPDADGRVARIEALLGRAQAAGVAVQALAQQPAAAATGRLAAWPLTLQLQGSYPALRGFAQAALRGDSALALDQIGLARSDAGAGPLQAELRLVFYERSNRPPEQPPSTAPAEAAR